MTPFIEEAHRLLRLAQRDLQTYRILAAHPDASLAATCFHAQQSVEKALKAVLTAHRVGLGFLPDPASRRRPCPSPCLRLCENLAIGLSPMK
jgi:hypothetical protein